jgi:tetratricopeptide (TPR) repeat protein
MKFSVNKKGPKIKEFHITPIAVVDPPLLNAAGLHAPYALRTVVELVTEDNISGISEIPGNIAIDKALDAKQKGDEVSIGYIGNAIDLLKESKFKEAEKAFEDADTMSGLFSEAFPQLVFLKGAYYYYLAEKYFIKHEFDKVISLNQTAEIYLSSLKESYQISEVKFLLARTYLGYVCAYLNAGIGLWVSS